MTPKHLENKVVNQNNQNANHSKKSSLWKLLCPCLSSKNSDSDGDDKMKDSYVRDEFCEEKTNNQELNIHEETQTNLPIDFKLPEFYAKKYVNFDHTNNENPKILVKKEESKVLTNGIKFNVKRSSTLEGYLNENRNPNIQISKQSSKQASYVNLQYEQNPRLRPQKPKKPIQNGLKSSSSESKTKEFFEKIDYSKMQKNRIYLIQILKQLQKMSSNTDYSFLKNEQDGLQKCYPVNKLTENKMIVIGDKTHKLLTKITSVRLYPSVVSIKRLKESLKNKETNSKASKKDDNFNSALDRFWDKRYFLFEKFDEGIQLDQQSWYSVTPESVADYISSRVNVKKTILDAFCGAGGDSLKLAGSCANIISNDIDEVKLKCLLNNAKIYDVQNITLSNSDYFKLDVKVDAVYLAPPWGGLDYFKIQSFHPADFEPKLTTIIQKAFTLSTNIFFLLPVNTDVQSLAVVINQEVCKIKDFKPESCTMRIQKIYFNDSLKFLLVLFGDSSVICDIKLGQELCYIYDIFREDDQTYFKYKKLIRKIREEYGMVNLLNYVFAAQNFKLEANKNNWTTQTMPMIEKFEKYLLKRNLIDEKSLAKIKEEQDLEYEYDLKHRQQKNKRLKEKKIRKLIENQQRERKGQKKAEPKNQDEKNEIDFQNDEIPLSEIVKKVRNDDNQNYNRKETFQSNLEIQSGVQENSQIQIRDSLRTVSIISEFHQDQLRNINHTERMTTNSEFSARDSIHPIQKFNQLDVSIDASLKFSQESNKMMPSSEEKNYHQTDREFVYRTSEPAVLFQKEQIKMKKIKVGTVYQKATVQDQKQRRNT